jgi:hypothetical protein
VIWSLEGKSDQGEAGSRCWPKDTTPAMSIQEVGRAGLSLLPSSSLRGAGSIQCEPSDVINCKVECWDLQRH